MAETSRPQVTITLGRSGQVVKRAGPVLDSELSDPVRAFGTKRSVRDRLGSSVDAVLLDNKRKMIVIPLYSSLSSASALYKWYGHELERLRGDNGRWSLKASNCMDDFHLSKDDLRFKIMKRTQINGQQNTVDLRDMLSRRAHPSTTKPGMPHSMHETKNERQRATGITSEPRDDRRRMPESRDNPRHMPEPINERQRMPLPRDERQHMPVPRDERRHMPEPRDERQGLPHPRNDRYRMPESRDDRQRIAEPTDGRQCMPEPSEVRQHIPKLNDARQRIPEATKVSMTGQFTSTRTSEASSQMGLLRTSYSPWTLDHIRRKSPDRVLNNSRGLSPPRRTEEPQRRPIMRAYDDPRTVTYASRDVGEISRPMTATPFLTKPSLSVGPTKSVGPIPPSGVVQRSRYPVEEPLTVEGFLLSLGLDKYVISFKVEEVDMAALSQMGDHDLKELGIPMGPRKKILLAILARSRRQA